jgi:hypothetical protein
MSAITSYTSHDYIRTTPVPVIASFDSDGHIAPLYVRISGTSCKVHSFWVNNRFANQVEFHCQVIDHDTLRPLLLTYYKPEDVWAICSQE